jgi:hypothetical protein
MQKRNAEADSSAALRNDKQKSDKSKENCKNKQLQMRGVLRFAQNDTLLGELGFKEGGEVAFVGCELCFGGGAVE